MGIPTDIVCSIGEKMAEGTSEAANQAHYNGGSMSSLVDSATVCRSQMCLFTLYMLFRASQESALQDYLEVSLMLQYLCIKLQRIIGENNLKM